VNIQRYTRQRLAHTSASPSFVVLPSSESAMRIMQIASFSHHHHHHHNRCKQRSIMKIALFGSVVLVAITSFSVSSAQSFLDLPLYKPLRGLRNLQVVSCVKGGEGMCKAIPQGFCRANCTGGNCQAIGQLPCRNDTACRGCFGSLATAACVNVPKPSDCVPKNNTQSCTVKCGMGL
jgi:hypothetical protein